MELILNNSFAKPDYMTPDSILEVVGGDASRLPYGITKIHRRPNETPAYSVTSFKHAQWDQAVVFHSRPRSTISMVVPIPSTFGPEGRSKALWRVYVVSKRNNKFANIGSVNGAIFEMELTRRFDGYSMNAWMPTIRVNSRVDDYGNIVPFTASSIRFCRYYPDRNIEVALELYNYQTDGDTFTYNHWAVGMRALSSNDVMVLKCGDQWDAILGDMTEFNFNDPFPVDSFTAVCMTGSA